MRSYWTLQCNAKNEKNAATLFNRVVKLLQAEVIQEELLANAGAGYTIKWELSHQKKSWNDYLVEVLQLAQTIGNGWLITGDVRQECSAWCNRPRVSGVQTIEWSIRQRAETEKESEK